MGNGTWRDRAILDYTSPITYSNMMQCVDLFAERYPQVSVTFIGESILGKSIPMVTLGDPTAEKGVAYIGAHHGMEWITAAVLLRFINEYGEYCKTGRQMYGVNLNYLARTRFIAVVPMLNPDGVDLQIGGIPEGCPMEERLLRMNGGRDFSRWQANIRGVDLNHNYGAGFKEYKSLEREAGITGVCATKYSGEYPESEPETAALCSYLRYNDSVKMMLTLHTQGEEIFCGDGSAPGCAKLGRMISRMTGYRQSKPEGTALYGGLTDWYVSELGKPGFTLECGKGENPLPLSDYFKIYAGLRELLFCAPMMV
ncbi:MAG: gamma-D-glutamyl-meso-diaminopimelate peptidase [Clostridia bacterium]|nr:gamma-D-glutamyl-meso-diaminopimelate peptidase [Clostridia bacterium]